MPKFKAGDRIIPIANRTCTARCTVVGYTIEGKLVYEYQVGDSAIQLGSSDEDAFVLAPTKVEQWVNVYKTDEGYQTGGGFPTEALALNAGRYTHQYVKTIKVEFEV